MPIKLNQNYIGLIIVKLPFGSVYTFDKFYKCVKFWIGTKLKLNEYLKFFFKKALIFMFCVGIINFFHLFDMFNVISLYKILLMVIVMVKILYYNFVYYKIIFNFNRILIILFFQKLN